MDCVDAHRDVLKITFYKEIACVRELLQMEISCDPRAAKIATSIDWQVFEKRVYAVNSVPTPSESRVCHDAETLEAFSFNE